MFYGRDFAKTSIWYEKTADKGQDITLGDQVVGSAHPGYKRSIEDVLKLWSQDFKLYDTNYSTLQDKVRSNPRLLHHHPRYLNQK